MIMTDRAIIKALEYCSTKGNCYKCYYQEWYTTRKCREHLAKEALDLIQRQQERIERLKDNLDAVLAERADHTEAINEFADRLKENLTGWATDPTDEEIDYTINNLVKEMVGE